MRLRTATSTSITANAKNTTAVFIDGFSCTFYSPSSLIDVAIMKIRATTIPAPIAYIQ